MTGPRCLDCGGASVLTPGTELFSYGAERDLMYWVCEDCFARVRCHDGSTRPMGRPAGRSTALLRREAHLLFDAIWSPCAGSMIDGMSAREWLYHALATDLGLSRDRCHIGMFNDEMCRRVIAWCQIPRARRKSPR